MIFTVLDKNMGKIKQYECPKCGYKPPILHFGCGFHLSYEVYVCRECQTIHDFLISVHDSDMTKEGYGKCFHHASIITLEKPYNIMVEANLLEEYKDIPHLKHYHGLKGFSKIVSRGCIYHIHCNGCNQDIECDNYQDDFTPQCPKCNNTNLEKWDGIYCPRCNGEMVLEVSNEGFFFAEWD